LPFRAEEGGPPADGRVGPIAALPPAAPPASSSVPSSSDAPTPRDGVTTITVTGPSADGTLHLRLVTVFALHPHAVAHALARSDAEPRTRFRDVHSRRRVALCSDLLSPGEDEAEDGVVADWVTEVQQKARVGVGPLSKELPTAMHCRTTLRSRGNTWDTDSATFQFALVGDCESGRLPGDGGLCPMRELRGVWTCIAEPPLGLRVDPDGGGEGDVLDAEASSASFGDVGWVARPDSPITSMLLRTRSGRRAAAARDAAGWAVESQKARAARRAAGIGGDGSFRGDAADSSPPHLVERCRWSRVVLEQTLRPRLPPGALRAVPGLGRVLRSAARRAALRAVADLRGVEDNEWDGGRPASVAWTQARADADAEGDGGAPIRGWGVDAAEGAHGWRELRGGVAAILVMGVSDSALARGAARAEARAKARAVAVGLGSARGSLDAASAHHLPPRRPRPPPLDLPVTFPPASAPSPGSPPTSPEPTTVAATPTGIMSMPLREGTSGRSTVWWATWIEWTEWVLPEIPDGVAA